jgi:hypothetical protein
MTVTSFRSSHKQTAPILTVRLRISLPPTFRRVFFVVHSPSDDLANAKDLPPYIELVPPMRLAERAVNAGLSKSIEGKVS